MERTCLIAAAVVRMLERWRAQPGPCWLCPARALPGVKFTLTVGSVRDVPESYPALDWLVRRRTGESVALIAQRAGVPVSAVVRATKPYGPFPRPTQLVNNRTMVAEGLLGARAAAWIEARQHGQAVSSIASAAGVSHQWVSKATAGHGPYPSAKVVEGWADARRSGQSVDEIAATHGVRAATVRRCTAPFGPFYARGPRLPSGVMNVSAIARRAGVSKPTVLRWQATRKLPEPDFTTARGRSLWLSATVESWLSTSEALSTCTVCGARCLSVPHHTAEVHTQPRRRFGT